MLLPYFKRDPFFSHALIAIVYSAMHVAFDVGQHGFAVLAYDPEPSHASADSAAEVVRGRGGALEVVDSFRIERTVEALDDPSQSLREAVAGDPIPTSEPAREDVTAVSIGHPPNQRRADNFKRHWCKRNNVRPPRFGALCRDL